MSELDAIDEALGSIDGDRAPAVATVVRVEGSSYRRPGARMFVFADGRKIGTVSGGCLEADVASRAREALRRRESEYVLYDKSASNGDVVAELGCNGSVGVLIEPACLPGPRLALESLTRMGRSRSRGAMATVFRVQRARRLRVGDRVVLESRGDAPIGRSGAEVDPAVYGGLLQSLDFGRIETHALAIDGGTANVLFEPILPPIALVICGTGPDAMALASAARPLGWQVRHADAPVASKCPPAELPPDERTAVVIMTHNYARDLEWVRLFRPVIAPYVGLLGPAHRAERLLRDLEAGGIHLGREERARFYGLAGLDVGAETPEEIAASIVAEIMAVTGGRSGGSLRVRGAPIHGAVATGRLR
jgi:xanthine dehydrogenase accessory factor